MGRKRIYKNAAERQKAYRERKKLSEKRKKLEAIESKIREQGYENIHEFLVAVHEGEIRKGVKSMDEVIKIFFQLLSNCSSILPLRFNKVIRIVGYELFTLVPFLISTLVPIHLRSEGLYLGIDVHSGEKVFWNFNKSLSPHIVVLGPTGSGKTEFLSMVSSRLSELGIRVIVYDVKGEYTERLSKWGCKFKEFILGRDVGLGIDRLLCHVSKKLRPIMFVDILEPLVSFDRRGKELISTLYRASSEILLSNDFISSNFLELMNELISEVSDQYLSYKLSKVLNILENLNTIGIIAYNSFFTNLSFFNPASNKFGKEKEVFDKFDNFLNNYFVRDDRFASDLFDKSLSPFVYSASDFKNQLYGKPQTLKSIERAFGINPAYYILSFPLAFLWMKGKYYMFYAQDLRFTYSVNKRLKDLIQRSIKNGKSSVFEITWNIIIDKINEYKAISSLENMYIVEYSDITNQQINNVEYIGISKLQASLIIDDHIREYLNKSIPTPKKVKNKTIWVWLLEEFIKNKPLMLHIVNYIHGKISGDWKENEEKVGKYTLITSLAVDAEIKKMKSRVYGERIFDTDFFSSYKNVVDNVKNTISTMYSSQKATQNVIEKDDKTKIAISLFGYINNRNKYGFVNLLLKYMTGKTTQSVESKGLLVNYLFNNVLSNTICWENYALSIVIGVT